MGKRKKKTKQIIDTKSFAMRYGYKEKTIKKNIDKIEIAKAIATVVGTYHAQFIQQ
jgi:hypothetical protein